MKEKERAPFIVGALAAAVIGLSCGPKHEAINTLPPATPITTIALAEVLPKTDDQIIMEEVKRLGISVNEQEGILWRTFGYNRSIQKLPINDTTSQEAVQRVQSTFVLMQQSQNPYIKNAASFIVPLVSSNDASITIYMGGDSEGKGSAMSASPELKDGRLRWHIAIAANEALNNSSSITLALQLTHEIEHIKNMITYDKSLPSSLSPQERYEKALQRKNNPKEYIEEEARGYAAQAQALIYAYGLGFRGSPGLSHEKYAAEFIRDSSNPASQEWQKYVAEEILGIQNWQPEEN